MKRRERIKLHPFASLRDSLLSSAHLKVEPNGIKMAKRITRVKCQTLSKLRFRLLEVPKKQHIGPHQRDMSLGILGIKL